MLSGYPALRQAPFSDGFCLMPQNLQAAADPESPTVAINDQ
jgi:hypothetical protein